MKPFIMKSNQLPLFDESYSIKVDQFIFEIQNMVSNYKYTTLLVDQSLGKDNKMFINLKACAKTLAELLPIFSPLSNKYRHYTKQMWEKLGTYDPYYCPAEPRSISRLHDIARDYDRASKSLLLRFKTILESRVTETEPVIGYFVGYKLAVDLNFKKQYHYEF